MSLRERLRTALRRRAWTEFTIAHDSNGMQIIWSSADEKSGGYRLEWSEIKSVLAFKRDLMIVDLICMSFETHDGTFYEVNEEMAGWDSLLESLPKQLPGALDRVQLLTSVMQPPFELKETTIYSDTRKASK